MKAGKRALSPAEARTVLAGRPIARTGLTGAAGEYFVAAELSLRGWLATVTIKNAPGTDVLAQKLGETSTTVAIQTKAASHPYDFQLNAKCEAPSAANNEWYVFVQLNEELTRPSFYVVPRNVVAAAVYADHRSWLAQPGRWGQARKDTSMRKIRPTRLWDTGRIGACLMRRQTRLRYYSHRGSSKQSHGSDSRQAIQPDPKWSPSDRARTDIWPPGKARQGAVHRKRRRMKREYA